MKTGTMFWNQLKWDLRFVWWAFAAVLVLAPFQVWLEMKELRGDFEQQEMVLSIAVWALMMLVAGVGVMSVIQKEVPFGRKEFWLTRPVSRGTVLGSKLVILGLFLSLLGMSWLTTPLFTGSGEWLWMFGINFLVTWSWMLVVAAVLASLSSSLMRMFINAAILGAVVVGVLLLREVLFPKVHRYREGNEILEFGWMALLPLLLAGGGLGVVAWLYFTRRPRIGIGVFTTLLVAGFLSVDRGYKFEGFENLVSRSLEREEGWDEMVFKLQWREQESGKSVRVGYLDFNGEIYYKIRASTSLGNVPSSGFVRNVLFRGEVMAGGARVWEDATRWGKSTQRDTWGHSHGAAALLPSKLDGYKTLSGGKVRYSMVGEQTFTQQVKVATVPFEELVWWIGENVSYSGEARIYVEDFVQLARVPLKQDFELESAGVRLRGKVSSRRDGEEGFFLSLNVSSLITFPFEERLSRRGFAGFLVNKERGEFVKLEGGLVSSRNTMRLQLWQVDLSLSDSSEVFASVVERDSWLADCELQIYGQEQKGSFVRKVELQEISLEELVSIGK